MSFILKSIFETFFPNRSSLLNIVLNPGSFLTFSSMSVTCSLMRNSMCSLNSMPWRSAYSNARTKLHTSSLKTLRLVTESRSPCTVNPWSRWTVFLAVLFRA